MSNYMVESYLEKWHHSTNNKKHAFSKKERNFQAFFHLSKPFQKC